MVSTTHAPSPLHLHSPSSSSSSSSSSSLATTPATSPASLPQKKKMSITQTYFLAHKARAKLSREAGQPDHNLRLLVGHANLLDSLMLDLAEAEREQESWFNQSVRGAAPKTEERHIQWADSIPTRNDADWEADDSSDSDSDSDLSEDDEDLDEDVEMADAVSYRRAPAGSVVPSSPQLSHIGVDEIDEEDDEEDEEDIDSLTLTRSPSHTAASPPELDLDSDTSEDESMPPSPPFATLPTFSDKQRESAYGSHSKPEEGEKADFYNEGYYIPQRNPARLVSAISVY